MEDWKNKVCTWISKGKMLKLISLQVQGLTSLAQLKQQDDDISKYRTALELLLMAEKEANNLIAAVQAAIEEHDAAGKILKAQAAEARQAIEASTSSSNDKGKGRATEIDDNTGRDGRLLRSHGTFLEVLHRYDNIAPILDAVLADVDESGQVCIFRHRTFLLCALYAHKYTDPGRNMFWSSQRRFTTSNPNSG